MSDEEAIKNLVGRVQALLTAVNQSPDRHRRPVELWPNSRIVRELQSAMLLLKVPCEAREAMAQPEDPRPGSGFDTDNTRWAGKA